LCEPQKRNELAFFWQIISEFHLTAIKILVKVKYNTYAFGGREEANELWIQGLLFKQILSRQTLLVFVNL
jgi:hypothetical protein